VSLEVLDDIEGQSVAGPIRQGFSEFTLQVHIIGVTSIVRSGGCPSVRRSLSGTKSCTGAYPGQCAEH
jgi:hypothetical protein